MTIASEPVKMTCFFCKCEQMVSAKAHSTTCHKCGATARGFRCTECHKIARIWSEKDPDLWKFTCPNCGAAQQHHLAGRVPMPRRRRIIYTAGAALFTLIFGVGLMLVVLLGPHKPDLNCNGKTLHPGEVCHVVEYRNGNKVSESDQTYEDRVNRANGPHNPLGIVATTAVILLISAAVGRLAWRWSAQAPVTRWL